MRLSMVLLCFVVVLAAFRVSADLLVYHDNGIGFSLMSLAISAWIVTRALQGRFQ